MTLAEFKSWFEGFTEGMEARPTDKQWKRIKARVKEINGTTITREVWLRDYYRPYQPYWTNYCTSDNVAYSATSAKPLSYDSLTASLPAATVETTALYDAGKAEYAESLSVT